MTLIRSVHALVYTGSQDGAGTDGGVYLGAGGREFRLNKAQNDFETGSVEVYRFGTFSTVADPTTNDPQEQDLVLEDVDRYPVYIRFAPADSTDRWRLERAVVIFNSDWSPMYDSVATAPDGIWLGVRSGLWFHLPRMRPELNPRADTIDDVESRFREAGVEAPRSPVPREANAETLLERPPAPSGARTTTAVLSQWTDEPATAASAAEALSPASRRGLASVGLDLRDPADWGLLAYSSACSRQGTARSIRLREISYLQADGSIMVISEDEGWPHEDGVCCGFEVDGDGLVALTARVRSWHPWGGVVECRIDTRSFGFVTIGATPMLLTFLARLDGGVHEFVVRRGSDLPEIFLSFTAHTVPINAPPG